MIRVGYRGVLLHEHHHLGVPDTGMTCSGTSYLVHISIKGSVFIQFGAQAQCLMLGAYTTLFQLPAWVASSVSFIGDLSNRCVSSLNRFLFPGLSSAPSPPPCSFLFCLLCSQTPPFSLAVTCLMLRENHHATHPFIVDVLRREQ